VEDRVSTPGLGNVRQSVQVSVGVVVSIVDRGECSFLVDCIEEKHGLCWSAILLCCYSGEVIRDGVFVWRETEYGIKE